MVGDYVQRATAADRDEPPSAGLPGIVHAVCHLEATGGRHHLRIDAGPGESRLNLLDLFGSAPGLTVKENQPAHTAPPAATTPRSMSAKAIRASAVKAGAASRTWRRRSTS